MKQLIPGGLSLLAIVLFGAMPGSNDNNKVLVQSKDTSLPDWQWTSGEVAMGKIAAKECFIISFDPKIYHSRDSIKITFGSYNVAITHLEKRKIVGQWSGRVELDYFINNTWTPLINDTNDRLNQPFSGKNNVTEESLKNYTIRLTVPINRTLTLTTSSKSFEIDNDNSLPELGNTGPTLTTSIHGIEITKLP